MSKSLSEEELVGVLRKMVGQSSQKQVSADLKIARAFLNDVLHGRRAVTSRLANGLGYERTIVYRKAV